MQLLEEATDYAGEYIAGKISAAENSIELLDSLVDGYRQQLVRSDYRAGCPIVAVTVEAGDPDEPRRATKVIERAAAAFALWTDLIGNVCSAEGVTASARRGTGDAGDDLHRGRDRRRPGIPGRQTARSRSSSAARTAAGRHRRKDVPMTSDWQSTACILCECNCGIVVQTRGPHPRQDPRRQGTSGVAGLHLQQGAAARSLPEQPQQADVADAPTARRQLRGNRLGHRDHRDRRGLQAHPRHLRRRQDLLLRRRRPG